MEKGEMDVVEVGQKRMAAAKRNCEKQGIVEMFMGRNVRKLGEGRMGKLAKAKNGERFVAERDVREVVPIQLPEPKVKSRRKGKLTAGVNENVC
jgi:hypothetical protein